MYDADEGKEELKAALTEADFVSIGEKALERKL